MRTKNCKNCKNPIPKGKECYIGARVVCYGCFTKLKGNKSFRRSAEKEYFRWIVSKG